MNNNLTTERSHLGVFSTTTYITIGDGYGKKSDPDPRLQGKQFTADFPKGGIAGARPNNSLFDREHKWLYGGEKYALWPSHPPRSRARLARAPMPHTRSAAAPGNQLSASLPRANSEQVH